MYCSQCGQPIGAQAFCKQCGASTGIATDVLAARPSVGMISRVAAHLRTLGILWIAFSVYLLLRWLLVLPVLHAIFGMNTRWGRGPDAWAYGGFHPAGWLLHLITVVVIVRVLLSLAVGIALLTRQPWGRIFAIVIAVLTLLKPIVGTLLAVYTLWTLLSRNAGEEYDRLALSKEVPIP